MFPAFLFSSFFFWVGLILAVGLLTARLLLNAVMEKGVDRWALACLSLIVLIVLESPAAFLMAHFPEDCDFGVEGSALLEQRHGLFGTRCVLVEPGGARHVEYHDKTGQVVMAYAVGNLILLGGLYPLAELWQNRHSHPNCSVWSPDSGDESEHLSQKEES